MAWIAALPAQAALPADAVPDSASVVVRFKSPQASLDKLAEFVNAVQPGAGAAVQATLPGLGAALGNPELTGVDLDKDIWAVMFAQGQGQPLVVFIVTAKDVDDIKDALPANYEVHASGKLVAYSEDADALGEVRDRIAGEGKPLWSKVDAASKKLFDAADLSVLVNIKQLAEDFADELDQAEPQLNAAIDQLLQVMPEEQRPQLEAAFGVYRVLGGAILRGVRDSNSLALGITFSNAAIRYEDRLQVTEGTATAKFFAGQTPGELALVGKLPPNKPIYTGIKADMSSMIEWSLSVTKGLMKDASDEQKAEFEAAMKEMSKLKYEELAMYMDIGKEAPAFRAGGVSVVTPADRLRAISHKMLKSMGEIRMPSFKQSTTLEPNALKIGGFDVDRILIKQEFDETADPLGVQKKMQSILFGDAGMEQLVLYRKDQTLQSLGGKAEMQSLLTSLDSTKPGDPAVAAARKRFPDKANVLLLIDIARLIQSGFTLAAKQGAIGLDADAISDLKIEPSYIGYSLTLEPTAARTQWEVPATQVQNIVQLIPLLTPR
jgi:hypothetical protein